MLAPVTAVVPVADVAVPTPIVNGGVARCEAKTLNDSQAGVVLDMVFAVVAPTIPPKTA